MIARGFKSVVWVATVGAAALGCYMVSLRVATERNDLERVEREIAAAQRDIRTLKTELGTRGRLSQLEHWNADVLALAAPASAQYLPDTLTLARLERREPSVEDRGAEVRLASADTGSHTSGASPAQVVQAVAAAPDQAPAAAIVHQASFTQMATVKPTTKPKARPETVAPDAAKPLKPATATATATASAKPAPAKGAPAASARLDAKLAQEIGAAARHETKGEGGGGN